MRKRIKKGLVLLTTFLLLSAFMIPLTGYLEQSKAYKPGNHQTITEKALIVLYHDGRSRIPEWFDNMNLKDDLILGAKQADVLDQSKSHYYDPDTGEGLSEFKDAKTRFSEKVTKANKHMVAGEYEDMAFQLGWACHILQDMSVPFHTNPTPVNGHSEYESWAENNMDLNSTNNGGFYNNTSKWGDWVHGLAEYSKPYYKYVNSDNATEENYTLALSDLNPRAIRYTAGFLDEIFRTFLKHGIQLMVEEKTDDTISLRWSQDFSKSFSHYRIKVSENRSGLNNNNLVTEKNITDMNITSYTVSSLDGLTKYFITVEVVRDDKFNLYSNLVETRTKWPLSTFISLSLIIAAVLAVARYVFYSNDYDQKLRKTVRRR